MIENEWTYYVNANERIAKIIPTETQAPGNNTQNSTFRLSLTQLSFYETDHLGNTRIVFSPEKFNADGSVDRKIHFAADYYPYGKTLRYFETSTFEEKYLTTQHERDRETGFDYRHARIYDSEIGRFLSLDPLASQYPAWSDYNYVLGNPIMLIDPDGREAKETKWTENHKRLNETFGDGHGFNELIDEQCDDCPDKKYVFGKATTYLEPTKENKSYIGPSSFVNRAAEIANTQHWNNYYNQQKLIYSPMKPFVLIGEGLQIGSIAWPTPFGVSAGVAKLGKIWNTVRLSMKGNSTVIKETPKYLYHYTSREAAQSISQNGLRVGKDGFSYLTNKSTLTPFQAQIELALPANRAFPNSLIRINTSGLSPASVVRRVQGNLSGLGPGGGTEFLFNQTIPANAIKIIK